MFFHPVPITEVGSQCKLTFKMPGITSFDLSASVTSPGGVTDDAEIKEIEDGLYAVAFVPKVKKKKCLLPSKQHPSEKFSLNHNFVDQMDQVFMIHIKNKVLSQQIVAKCIGKYVGKATFLVGCASMAPRTILDASTCT